MQHLHERTGLRTSSTYYLNRCYLVQLPGANAASRSIIRDNPGVKFLAVGPVRRQAAGIGTRRRWTTCEEQGIIHLPQSWELWIELKVHASRVLLFTDA